MPVFAGRIVINSDEWPLSDPGFTNAAGLNASNFAVNLATFLAPANNNILIYSNDFGLTQSSLSTVLTNAGYNVTTTTGAFNPSGFGAIFLAGSLHSATTSDLINFVNSGGGVYIAAGISGSSDLSANLFNPFLNTFGLGFSSSFAFIGGFLDAIDSQVHPLFGGVSQLYYDGVNEALGTGASPFASVVEFQGTSSFGLIASYDGPDQVPEPASALLVALGTAILALRGRKCCSNPF